MSSVVAANLPPALHGTPFLNSEQRTNINEPVNVVDDVSDVCVSSQHFHSFGKRLSVRLQIIRQRFSNRKLLISHT
jgi:hypothetical protein